MRIDIFLVAHGYFPSRNKAQEAIAHGLVSLRWTHSLHSTQESSANGTSTRPVHSPSESIDENRPPEIIIAASDQMRFVSRAGLKLEGALMQLGLSVEDQCGLDVGMSTGGFTDCLLQRGARKVVGLDVGHNQLNLRIKADPRVVYFEGLNARDSQQISVVQSEMPAGGFDFVVMDVSFISQTLIAPQIWPLLRPMGHWLSLIKPQFELGPEALSRGGLVKDPKSHQQACARTSLCLQNLGAHDIKIIESPIEGKDGNHEFFLFTQKPANPP